MGALINHDMDIEMHLLNEYSTAVTLNFSLPPEFQPSPDGDNETVVTVRAVNTKLPISIDEWRRPRLFHAGWKFNFQHPHESIGIQYQVNVQMFQNGQPLLIEQNYFVAVNHVPHRQTIHLSPIGQLYVEVQQPNTLVAEETVTISLHDVAEPDIELVRVSHDEQTANAFYLQYDPALVAPGKRYALTGIENRYHQQIKVYPDNVELAPTSVRTPLPLMQRLSQWVLNPLRLFTDVSAKIR